MLHPEERKRYSRQTILPQFGTEGQLKLKKAKVLVIGAGGLGAPILQYLTAAGVGTIGIVDFDVVDETNLHRQVLFGPTDVDKPKVDVAIQRLKAQNEFVSFVPHQERLDRFNAIEIIQQYDVVIDGTDNFATRYLVNDACVLASKPLVYGSIFQFDGQVSVFNQLHEDGSRGPNYRDLFPTPPPPDSVPSCAEGGVLGVLPAIIGSLQATEAIKLITGIGNTLSGRLLTYDALSNQQHIFKIKPQTDNPLTGIEPTQFELIDYDQFCGTISNTTIPTITVESLKALIKSNQEVQIIDVRTIAEYKAFNINGLLIPLAELAVHRAKIRKDIPVIVHCQSGVRSQKAVELLQESYQFDNVKHLEGGLNAW